MLPRQQTKYDAHSTTTHIAPLELVDAGSGLPQPPVPGIAPLSRYTEVHVSIGPGTGPFTGSYCYRVLDHWDRVVVSFMGHQLQVNSS